MSLIPKCRKSGKHAKRPGWLNRELEQLLKMKKDMFTRWKKGDIPKEDYKEVCRECRTKIRNAKENNELRLARDATSNKKGFWGYVKGKKKNRDAIGILQDENGTLIHDDSEKVEVLNSYFVSVFTEKENLSIINTEWAIDSTKKPTLSINGDKFMTLISIIFAAGVVTLVLGLVYKDKIDPELEKNMTFLFQKYDAKNAESSAVDFIQEELECCGMLNYTSWQNTTWFLTNYSVPLSCCKKNETGCQGKLDAPNKIYPEGCEGKLETLIHKVLGFAMLVILGFAVLELLALISLCIINRGHNRQGYQVL